MGIRIEMELSGHMNFGSVYNTSNSCDNCDGANCDYCEKLYTVENKTFTNLDKAKEYAKSYEEAIIVDGVVCEAPCDMDHNSTVIDGVLYTLNDRDLVQVYKRFAGYEELFAHAQKKSNIWIGCTKKEKCDKWYGNCCGTLKRCNSSICYKDTSDSRIDQ